MLLLTTLSHSCFKSPTLSSQLGQIPSVGVYMHLFMLAVTLRSRDPQESEGIFPQGMSLKINAIAARPLLVTFCTSSEQNEPRSCDAKAFTTNTPHKFLTVGLPWADCERTARVERDQLSPLYKYALPLHCQKPSMYCSKIMRTWYT